MSLLQTNSSLSFKVYIIYSGFGENEQNMMREMVKNHTCVLHFLPLDDNSFEGVITKGRQHKVVYYNLMIPKLIDEDRILYLDVDLVVNGDIRPFYDSDFEDKYVIGVEDWKLFDRHDELDMAPEAKYFNNGAIVLNLKRMLEEDFSKLYFDYINQAKLLKFLDQDVINAVVNGRWKEMPLKFNAISSYVRHSFLKNNYFPKEWIEEAFHNPVIIHYTGGRKPWHYMSRNRFRSLYWKYLAMTSFSDYVEEDRNFVNVVKNTITKLSKKLQGKS
jgi:lipopolysaccharide biosynthesis glycosyltransferase